MPPRQVSRHDEQETTDSRWMTAAAALQAARRQEIILPPPTWMTLRELLPFANLLVWTMNSPYRMVDTPMPLPGSS